MKGEGRMEGLKGYMGKVLKIDLSEETFELFPWNDEDRKPRRTAGFFVIGEIFTKK